MEKTLQNLRKACKEIGITVKKESFTYGTHVSFYVKDRDIKLSKGTINYDQQWFVENQEIIEKFNKIKEDFQNMTINGERVYGLLK